MRGVLAVACVALLWSSPAFAQRTTGEIFGKITDESGLALPGVTVTLRGAGVAGAPTVVTSETGTYRFPVLPPGTYDLDYVLPGFAPQKRAAIEVAVGAIVEIELSMKVSTSYNHEWVQNAPVRRFSYFDLINSAPGVSATSNVGQATAAQSLGNSVNENSYQIDGTDISSAPRPNTATSRARYSTSSREWVGISSTATVTSISRATR